jgi:hypothetical protein
MIGRSGKRMNEAMSPYRSGSVKARLEGDAADGLGCVLILLLYALVYTASGVATGFALRYAVNTWLVVAHRSPAFPFWLGFAIGVIPELGPRLCVASVIGAVITVIASFFV